MPRDHPSRPLSSARDARCIARTFDAALCMLTETHRMAASMSMRSLYRLSGRSSPLRSCQVHAAPRSTPTAAGMIASFVAITVPTVAPTPACTSGHGSQMMVQDRQLCHVDQLLNGFRLDVFRPYGAGTLPCSGVS